MAGYFCGIFAQADPHARLQQRAEGLRQDHRQSALGKLVHALRLAARVAGIERHQRIDAEHQVDAVIQDDRGVHGPAQGAVDEVLAADIHRRIEAGQGGARLDGPRNRDVVPAGLPKRTASPLSRSTATTYSLRSSSRKSLLRPWLVKTPRRKRSIPALLKMPVGTSPPMRLTRWFRWDPVGSVSKRAPPIDGQPGKVRRAAQVLEKGRLQEDSWLELHFVAVAGDEDPVHLGRAQPVCQPGGQECAGTDADINIQPGRVEALDGLVERAQGAQFVHPADRAAAGNGQSDASLTANRLPGGLKKKHASRISGMSAAIVAGVVRLAS